jgi:DNA-binding PadR family transcriptional regulator
MFHRHRDHDGGGHWFGRRFARRRGDDGEHGHHGRHGEGRHWGGRHGGGMELRRFFRHGDLRLVILQLIAEKPRHGYEIIKAIEELVAGAYSPSPGVIYPTLTLLEELGYVQVTPGDGARKLHEITDAGRSFLDANRAAVDSLYARMTAANQMRGGGPAPQLVRAMENLKLALRLRQSRGPLSEEQIRAIAEALDAAAIAVERS